MLDDEGQGGKEAPGSIPRVTEYIINLDSKAGGVISEFEIEPIPKEGFVIPSRPTGGAVGKGSGTSYDANVNKTLRQILSYLKRFPDFRKSDKKVVIYSEAGHLKINGCIKDIAVNFDDVNETMEDQYRLFWGLIVNAENEFQGKGIWLNSSSSRKGLSVKIYEDIRDKFIEIFNIKDIDVLDGAYVLVAAKIHFTGPHKKPIVYCAIPNFITVQKYKEVNR